MVWGDEEAQGRLEGLVRSEAKRRASRENGRKGGLVKSRKKRIAAHLLIVVLSPAEVAAAPTSNTAPS